MMRFKAAKEPGKLGNAARYAIPAKQDPDEDVGDACFAGQMRYAAHPILKGESPSEPVASISQLSTIH